MIKELPARRAEDRIRRSLPPLVQKLGRAIAAGEVTPEPLELDALADICTEFQLPLLATRVRQWKRTT
jgi:hypothetical protein